MRPLRARPTTPTSAERVRSILASAHSMTVVTDGVRTEVRHLDNKTAFGHIHLHAPSEDADVKPSTLIPIRLELTDISPTPVRDRLRARVTMTGLLAAPYNTETAESTCMEFGQAFLDGPDGRSQVTFQDLEATELDPIAASEAGMLTHLLDQHSKLIPLLLRLVHPRPERGMTRALPVAMDRYGLTLRLEYPHAHRDVRLPFKTTVTNIDQAGPQVRALLATARRVTHRNHLLT
ncbi:DUF2470 domain-containing protein [Streptomyces sp. CT34]|uniref:DUF2470 domain-containing protein n=1 Tax=Streptomyces sp. CT34 TaxID=1553907 RepID=UPI0005BAC7CA|nr:DUF2470 domain-containing protein [Streptomyces sp. CT34]